MNTSGSQGFWSRLRRIPSRGWVGGVCAGFADYFGWNVRLIRALVVIATLFVLGPMAFVAYAVLWYVMERGPATATVAAPEPGFAPPEAAARRPEPRERLRRLEQRLAALEECVTSEEFELRREFRKLGA